MIVKLRPIVNFKLNGFVPYLSFKTFDIHYNILHKGYVNKINIILEKNNNFFFTNKDTNIFDILVSLYKEVNNEKLEIRKNVLNNLKNASLGHLNHTFFWNILNNKISSLSNLYTELYKQIKKDFISIQNMFLIINKVGNMLFSNGWLWLVYNIKDQKLEVITTKNHYNPLFFVRDYYLPIFTIDLWEHAYIIDYGKKKLRVNYINDIINFINWKEVNKLFIFAKKSKNIHYYIENLKEVLLF